MSKNGEVSEKEKAFCTPGFGLFGTMIDLGLNLEPLRNRIRDCKLRYHRELWGIICDLGIQGIAGWKKQAKDDLGGKEGGEEGAGGEGGGEEGGEEANQSNILSGRGIWEIRNRNKSNVASTNFGQSTIQVSSSVLKQQHPQSQQRHRPWPQRSTQRPWQQPLQFQQQQTQLEPNPWSFGGPLVVENANYLSHARAKLPSAGRKNFNKIGVGRDGSCSSSSLKSADDASECDFTELPHLRGFEPPQPPLLEETKFVPIRCGDWSQKAKERGSELRPKHGKHMRL